MNEIIGKLREPFPARDIEWRVQRSGEKNGKIWAMVLAYVNNRAIMDRLDSVVGPDGWVNQYVAGPNGGVMCGISIKLNDEWLTKWDGADNTNIEPVKGGLSDSMKRAAVQWGIGRYLYHLPAGWANVHESGKYRDKTKDNKWYKWDPPELPGWALPDGAGEMTAPKNGNNGRDNEQKVNLTPLKKGLDKTLQSAVDEGFIDEAKKKETLEHANKYDSPESLGAYIQKVRDKLEAKRNTAAAEKVFDGQQVEDKELF
jgi:hypothetical protein